MVTNSNIQNDHRRKIKHNTRLILIASPCSSFIGKKDASLYILIIGLIIVIVIYSQEKPTIVEGFEFPPKGETEIINGEIVDNEGEKNEIATNLGTPSSKGRTIGGVTYQVEEHPFIHAMLHTIQQQCLETVL